MLRHGAALAAVVLALAACSDENEAATVSSTATPPTTIASTDVTEVTDAATPPTTGTTSTTAPGNDCETAGSISGDFDGDGDPDVAAFDAGRSELVVCHAGSVARLAGSGQGEVLRAADLNGDGVDEILTGGTTAWGAGADMAAIVDGVLDFVALPTGERLTLWEGLPPDGFFAYGCGDFTGEGEAEIAMIEGILAAPNAAAWERTVYRVQGHDAFVVSNDSGSFDPSGLVDVLSAPELLSIRGDTCV